MNYIIKMVIAIGLAILSYYKKTLQSPILFKAIAICYLMFIALDLTIEFHIKSLQ